MVLVINSSYIPIVVPFGCMWGDNPHTRFVIYVGYLSEMGEFLISVYNEQNFTHTIR